MKTIYIMASPYGHMLTTPFDWKVKNGTRLVFCHILGDCFVVKPETANGQPESNIRLEVPTHWLKEVK